MTPGQVGELVRAYKTGEDMIELAGRWGVHRTTVAGHLRRAGVELRRQGLDEQRVALAARLYEEGWSCGRLAEWFHCDDETVRQVLKRSGVRMRSPWERT